MVGLPRVSQVVGVVRGRDVFGGESSGQATVEGGPKMVGGVADW